MTAPLPLINLTATQIPHGSATQTAIDLDWEKQAPDDTRKVRVPILTIRGGPAQRIRVTFSTTHTMTVGEQVRVTGSAIVLHGGLHSVYAIESSTVVILDKVYQGDETFTGNAFTVQSTGNYTTEVQRRPSSGGAWVDVCVIVLGDDESVTTVPIVWADEPTGNLDQQTGEQVSDLLFDLVSEQGMTLVLVTHNQELARRCTRQHTLQAGALH